MEYNITEKRPSIILVPYYRENDEVYVLLQKRSKDAPRLPGFFGFFGGGIKKEESPEQGLKREIQEELSIDISSYPYQYFNHYEFYGKIADVYTMEVTKVFLSMAKVHEGDYGRFFTESEVAAEQKLILPDKVILANFFGLIKRNNPYS